MYGPESGSLKRVHLSRPLAFGPCRNRGDVLQAIELPERTGLRTAAFVTTAVLVLAGLYLCSLYNYLLFHSIAEIFSIVVAFGIFMVGWNSRHYLENKYFLFLGIAYSFVGFLDVLHTLAYKGLGVFVGYDANLPTQLWIAARAMECLSLLLATLFIRRALRVSYLFLGYGLATFLLLGAIFSWEVFPDCFIEGSGLTPFKRISEYAIACILLVSAFRLYRERSRFDGHVLVLLLSSVFATIASELSFTLFMDPYGTFNLAGHYLKILSFFLIYRAIIYTGLRKPYRLLYADLQQKQDELRATHDELEIRVQLRTTELESANERLRLEIGERERTEKALHESQALYTTLIEASLTGVYMQQDEKIVFANERFAAIYGYAREEILGLESWKVVHPEDRSLVRRYNRKRIHGEDAPSEYEARGLTRDGRTIWVTRRITMISYKGRPAVLGNVADITKRKQMEHELSFLSAQILSAEENERKRIAQDLHDGIGQLLGAIKFRIESILLHRRGESASSDRETLQGVIALIQRTIEEMRRILADLRPSMLDDLGILPTINWLCREFKKTHSDMVLTKHIGIEEREVPEGLKTILYRVIQEALNNVGKHSQADQVLISLVLKDDTIVLEVEDDGIGFAASPRPNPEESSGGIGLHSMRERARLSGGVLELDTGTRKGTRIRVTWPTARDPFAPA